MRKILIIDMYSSKQVFALHKNRFKRSFENDVKIYFRRWDNISGIETILKKNIDGIIISGSDYFVGDKTSAIIQPIILKTDIPILSICYGLQYIVGKKNIKSFCNYRKYTNVYIIKEPFYVPKSKYYFYHRDYVINLQSRFAPKYYKK